MEKWDKVALSEICDLVAGFAFKSKDFGDYDSKVIKITHITPPSVDMDNLNGVDISKYNAEKLEKFIAQTGDYVLAMTGATIGKIGRIEHGKAYINQRVLLFKPRQCVDREYLYYALQQYEFAQYIIGHVDSESAQPNISAGTIGKYQIVLPPYEIQKKIGALLRAYDEKRENNRKINDNLQQQAQALFVAWFVNFIPFGGTAPNDWPYVSFADILTPRTEKSNDPSLPMYSVTDTGIYPRDEKFKKNLSMSNAKNKVIYNTDLVFGMSREILNWGIMRYDIGGVSSAYNVFSVSDTINSFYLESYIKHNGSYFRDLIKPASREGQGIDKNVLMQKQILLPPFDVLQSYYSLENALTQKIAYNQVENARLAELRDTLLPRLLTGEINVSNIDI